MRGVLRQWEALLAIEAHASGSDELATFVDARPGDLCISLAGGATPSSLPAH